MADLPPPPALDLPPPTLELPPALEAPPPLQPSHSRSTSSVENASGHTRQKSLPMPPPALTTPPTLSVPPPSLMTPTLRSGDRSPNMSPMGSPRQQIASHLASQIFSMDDFLGTYMGANLIRQRMLPLETDPNTAPTNELLEVDVIGAPSWVPITEPEFHRQFKLQFEWCLVRRKANVEDLTLDGALAAITPGSPNLTFDGKLVDKLNTLTSEEIERTSAVLKSYLIHRGTIETIPIVEFLIEVGNRFAFVTREARKLAPPKSKEIVQIPEDEQQPALAYLMDIFRTVVTQNAAVIAADNSIFGRCVGFCIDKIAFYFPAAVRQEAATCLGLLSTLNLEPIVNQFTEKMKVANKTDESAREYVTYQNASKHLALGIGHPKQEEATANYFKAVATLAEKCQRSVLQREICTSISHLMESTFSKCSNQDFEHMNGKTQLYQAFSSLFGVANKKWTKKTKLKSDCFLLMSSLVAYGGVTFFADKGPELVQDLIAGLKDKTTRRTYLESVHNYIRSFAPERLQLPAEEKTYVEQLDKLIPAVFPAQKKKETNAPVDKDLLTSPRLSARGFSPEQMSPRASSLNLRAQMTQSTESSVLYDILCHLGRQKPGYLLHQHINTIMVPTNKDFSEEQRGVILKALATLCMENPPAYAVDVFWRQINPVFNVYNGEASPLQQIFFCFPSISVADMRRQEVARKIAVIAVSKPDDISSLAVTSLQEFLLLNPDLHLPVLLGTTLEYTTEQLTTSWLGVSANVLLALKNICVYLQFYVDALAQSNQQVSTIEPSLWNELRQKMESLCLICLLHTDQQIWTKTRILLEILDKPILKNIEPSSQISERPHLSEAPELRANIPADFDGDFFPHWRSFYNNQFQRYSLAIVTMWIWSYDNWRKGAALWRNKMRLLAITSQSVFVSQRFKLEKFCEQMVGPIIDAAVNGTMDEQISQMIEAVSDFNEDTLPMLTHSLETEEAKRSEKKTKKKKEELYISEPIIRFLEQVMKRVTVRIYNTSEEIRNVIRYVIPVWVEHLLPFYLKESGTKSTLHSTTRTSIVNTTRYWIVLEGATTTPTPEEGPANLLRLTRVKDSKSILNFLMNLLSETNKGEKVASRNASLEEAILQTCAQLARHGNIKEEFLENRFLNFIVHFLELGPHTAPSVEHCLTVSLDVYHEVLLENFLRISMFGDNGALYLNAIVQNLQADTKRWIKICTPAKWLFITLFHQFSPYLRIRSLATDIANILAENDILNPGYFLPSSTLQVAQYRETEQLLQRQQNKVQLDKSELFLHFAKRYSDSIALRYPDLTNDFFSETEYYIKTIPTEDLITRRCLLQLLTPWTENLAIFTHKRENTRADIFLNRLFNISMDCTAVPLTPDVEAIWAGTISTQTNRQIAQLEGYDKDVTIHEVLDFLVTKTAEQWDASHSNTTSSKYTFDPVITPKIKALLKSITLYLSRVELNEVVNYLSLELVNYSAAVQPEDFVAKVMNAENFLVPQEGLWQPFGAFNLLIDLTFEAGPSVAPLLPLLLQNGTVLYGPSRTNGGSEGIEMVLNLLLNLGFQNGISRESRASSLELAKKIKDNQFNHHGDFRHRVLSSDEILQLVKTFTPHLPTLAQQWTDLSLNWTLHVCNYHKDITELNSLSSDSFKTFTTLITAYPQFFNVETAKRLSALFFKLICIQNDALLQAFYSFCQSLTVEMVQDPAARTEMAVLANVLLNTSYVVQFTTGLKILRLTGVETQVVYKDVEEVFRVMLKGLTEPDSLKLTIYILCRMAPLHQSETAVENLYIILLLMSSILVQLDDLDDDTMNAIRSFTYGKYPHLDAAIARSPVHANLPKADFLNEFFDAFYHSFGDSSQYHFTLDVVIIMFHRGADRWRYPLFKILEAILRRYPTTDSPSQAAHLNMIVAYFSLSLNDRLAQSATDIIPYIVPSLSLASTPDELFKLIRKTPVPLYPSSPSEYFHGDTKKDSRMAKYHNAKSLFLKSFELPADHPQMKYIESNLKVMQEDKIDHKPVLPVLKSLPTPPTGSAAPSSAPAAPAAPVAPAAPAAPVVPASAVPQGRFVMEESMDSLPPPYEEPPAPQEDEEPPPPPPFGEQPSPETPRKSLPTPPVRPHHLQ
ncbi:hypothetical protein PROFUN_00976 [Planoprotostelium fungivorum]|uniref:Cell morphogenesis protein N-terminal domain-containing protein n=1 Tax=Planoprotostelium fungivorum TaxID=1890364 RepID=A0A2P6N4D9_9EUKA|nr:hypothetical protein PROFUN_00976 [Planoprotostelium fungivorum]